MTEPSTKTTHTAATTTVQNDAVPPPPPPASKPIDEDLYKIPPELLLHTSKRVGPSLHSQPLSLSLLIFYLFLLRLT